MALVPSTGHRLRGLRNLFNKRIHLGNKGEERAVKFLKQNGYTILTRNYRKKFGHQLDRTAILRKNRLNLLFFGIGLKSLQYPCNILAQKILPFKGNLLIPKYIMIHLL